MANQLELGASRTPLATLSDHDGDFQERVIRRVFYRLKANYGSQLDNLIVGDDRMVEVLKAEWKKRLADIPVCRLSVGMDRLSDRPVRSRPFMPGAIEFADLCRPSPQELHIPEKWIGYEQAKAHEYRHPVIAHIVRKITRDRLTGQNPEQARREWSALYDELVDKARRGADFNWPIGMEPKTQAPKVKVARASAETAREHLEKIRKHAPSLADGGEGES